MFSLRRSNSTAIPAISTILGALYYISRYKRLSSRPHRTTSPRVVSRDTLGDESLPRDLSDIGYSIICLVLESRGTALCVNIALSVWQLIIQPGSDIQFNAISDQNPCSPEYKLILNEPTIRLEVACSVTMVKLKTKHLPAFVFIY